MIRNLWDLVTHDFWLKLFSLGLAALIWFTVSMAIRNEVVPGSGLALSGQKATFTVPVVVLSAASDVHDFKVAPKEVEVTIMADPKVVQKLESREIRAMVDLSGIEAVGDLRKRIEVSTPSGVTHVRVVPPEVRVLFPPRT